MATSSWAHTPGSVVLPAWPRRETDRKEHQVDCGTQYPSPLNPAQPPSRSIERKQEGANQVYIKQIKKRKGRNIKCDLCNSDNLRNSFLNHLELCQGRCFTKSIHLLLRCIATDVLFPNKKIKMHLFFLILLSASFPFIPGTAEVRSFPSPDW